ncbi:MAG: hypothetical protein IKC87_07775 [Clostridia bacterium]|nr:hypothetical protein [Clostridia bacterium]
MNYSNLIKGLSAEAFSGSQYKRLSGAFGVFAFIGVLPFFIMSCILAVSYHVSCFFFNALSSGVGYLESWLNEKKKDVNPITEAVLYFLTIPFIFFCHALLSIFSIIFFFIWFQLQCFAYIASLGGIRWQPYINRATYNEDDMFVATTDANAGKIVAAISCVLLLIAIIFSFVCIISDDYMTIERYNPTGFYAAHFAFTVLTVPLVFRKSKLEPADDDGEDNDTPASGPDATYTAPAAAPVEEVVEGNITTEG